MNASTTAANQPPAYFDRMIDAFHAGHTGRHAHLGHWDVGDDGFTGSLVTDFAAAQRRLNSELIGMANPTNESRVLDVACGFGGLVQQLDDTLTDCELHGVNIDDRQLDICQQLRSNNGNTLRWQAADACDLPFSDAMFDTVFCIEAMFHFQSRQQFLAEAKRVLKTGGMLAVTDFALTAPAAAPAFCLEAVLADGYGPWPDPWCRDGSALELIEGLNGGAWLNVRHIDATVNTYPSYEHVVSERCSIDIDPGDPAVRSSLLLQWLHVNGHLRYDYIAATAGDRS